MMKNKLTICFLLLACILQLGHSIFPHTHSKAHHHNGKHHHHHERSSDENGISLLFSHFNHSADTFSNGHLEEVVKVFKEVSFQLHIFETCNDSSKSFEFFTYTALAHNKEPLVFISPHLHSLQFRGPPTTL